MPADRFDFLSAFFSFDCEIGLFKRFVEYLNWIGKMRKCKIEEMATN